MNGIAAAFVLCSCVALLAVPRRWAPLPFLFGTFYVPYYLGLQLGPFHFTAIRMLVAVGVIRILSRKEWPSGRLSPLDSLCRSVLGALAGGDGPVPRSTHVAVRLPAGAHVRRVRHVLSAAGFLPLAGRCPAHRPASGLSADSARSGNAVRVVHGPQSVLHAWWHR